MPASPPPRSPPKVATRSAAHDCVNSQRGATERRARETRAQRSTRRGPSGRRPKPARRPGATDASAARSGRSPRSPTRDPRRGARPRDAQRRRRWRVRQRRRLAPRPLTSSRDTAADASKQSSSSSSPSSSRGRSAGRPGRSIHRSSALKTAGGPRPPLASLAVSIVVRGSFGRTEHKFSHHRGRQPQSFCPAAAQRGRRRCSGSAVLTARSSPPRWHKRGMLFARTGGWCSRRRFRLRRATEQRGGLRYDATLADADVPETSSDGVTTRRRTSRRGWMTRLRRGPRRRAWRPLSCRWAAFRRRARDDAGRPRDGAVSASLAALASPARACHGPGALRRRQQLGSYDNTAVALAARPRDGAPSATWRRGFVRSARPDGALLGANPFGQPATAPPPTTAWPRP